VSARYTFAACGSCGVPSPPIWLSGSSPDWLQLSEKLIEMGWVVNPQPYSVLATCPACHARLSHGESEATQSL